MKPATQIWFVIERSVYSYWVRHALRLQHDWRSTHTRHMNQVLTGSTEIFSPLNRGLTVLSLQLYNPWLGYLYIRIFSGNFYLVIRSKTMKVFHKFARIRYFNICSWLYIDVVSTEKLRIREYAWVMNVGWDFRECWSPTSLNLKLRFTIDTALLDLRREIRNL
jgi:hypothetical protein